MNYSSLFLDMYEAYGHGMDKDLFAKHVASKLPEFQDARDMYEPIEVSVKMVGGHDHYHGAARFSVAHTDEQWHNKLCRAVARTMNLPDATIPAMELRDIEGTPIRNMTAHELARAGELQVFVRNTPKRVQTVDDKVPQVPAEYSTNKQADIAAWFDSIRDGLTTEVSRTLATAKSWPELKQMLVPNGQVENEIQQYLEHHPLQGPGPKAWDWPEFVRVYSMDDVARNDPSGASQVSKHLAQHLLYGVKGMVKASHDQVTEHFNQLKALASETSEEDFWKTGDAVVSSPIGKSINPQHLFYDMVEDGLVPSRVGRKVVSLLYRRHKPQRVNTKTTIATPVSDVRGLTQHVRRNTNVNAYYRHPYYEYLQSYYQPAFERHSPHYMANHDKMDMSIGAEYPGDKKRVLEKFCLFTGRPRLPLPEHATQPIATIATEMPDLIPISQVLEPEMPDLIPISQVLEPEMPDLIPISQVLEPEMPDLIPISQVLEPEMPQLVPLSKVAPFAKSTNSASIRPSNIRSRYIGKHNVVDLETDEEEEESSDEVDIPNIMSFVRK